MSETFIFSQEQQTERTYGFSISPNFGFVYGQSLELVYSVPGESMNDLLSELTWDMKPVFYVGLQIDFGRVDPFAASGFFASLDFKAGIPGDSGKMEDRDWMSNENTALTHFSSHTNKTETFINFEAAIGATFPVLSFLYIKPFLSGSFTRFAFTGRDGYGIYARTKSGARLNRIEPYLPIDDDPYRESYDGVTVINYKQDWLILAAGVSAGIKLPANFSLNLSFQISPLTYCKAVDDHLDQVTGNPAFTYSDYTYWGLYIEPILCLSYSLNQFDFSLNFAYRYIGRTRGNSYSSEKGAAFKPIENKAGAGLSMTDIRLLAGIKF